jgi:hypothetical protein
MESQGSLPRSQQPAFIVRVETEARTVITSELTGFTTIQPAYKPYECSLLL